MYIYIYTLNERERESRRARNRGKARVKARDRESREEKTEKKLGGRAMVGSLLFFPSAAASSSQEATRPIHGDFSSWEKFKLF